MAFSFAKFSQQLRFSDSPTPVDHNELFAFSRHSFFEKFQFVTSLYKHHHTTKYINIIVIIIITIIILRLS